MCLRMSLLYTAYQATCISLQYYVVHDQPVFLTVCYDSSWKQWLQIILQNILLGTMYVPVDM